MSYSPDTEWPVEYTDEFETWWERLTEAEQEDVAAKVILLQRLGPALPRPHADVVRSSRYANMKELRIQHAGRPYRVLYAFDPPAVCDPVDRRGQDRQRSLVRDIRPAGGPAV